MKLRVIPLLALLLVWSALAQESTSFKLKEYVFNAGGTPASGVILTSTNFHMRLDAIGDGVTGSLLNSASFHVDGGFVGSYPPPGEVKNLTLSDTSLQWDPERSVGDYDLYRGLLSSLPGLGYGSCQQGGIAAEMTTDASTPPVGAGYFYLVTARNRIKEEGTKGFRSSGSERPNPAPCP